MAADDVIERLGPVFDRINQRLMTNLSSDIPYISQVCQYTLLSGGKRIRPALFILAARLCGYQGNQDYYYSVIFEHLHAASLLHDDVVDESDTRRGQAAAHVVYGNQGVILVGDHLVAKATSLAVETRLLKFLEVLSETASHLTEGEILELLHKRDIEITEAEYERLIYRKTGALIQAACKLGAVFSGARAEYEKSLSDYGGRVGQAFQMIDDVLDYSATASELGKPVGHDLEEGKITLPVILTLDQADNADRGEFRDLILKEKHSPGEFTRVKALIDKYQGLEQTREKAKHLVTEAKDCLTVFPERQEKKDLCDLADFIITRRK